MTNTHAQISIRIFEIPPFIIYLKNLLDKDTSKTGGIFFLFSFFSIF